MIRNNNDFATYTSPSSWYTLNYPPDWEFEESEDCTIFYRKSGGVGALQISAFETDEPESATASLLEYLDDEDIEAEVKTDLIPNGQELASCSYQNQSSKNKVWFVTKGTYLMFITYNSDSYLKTREEAEVDVILQTLQITP